MRLLKEPLFHFFLLGSLIFVWFAIVTPSGATEEEPDRIVIDERDISRLIEQYKAVWSRPPTAQELETLVDGLQREEVLVREAQAMGLQTGDAVIRGRLRQKMEFLTTSVAQSMTPDDDVLQEHLDTYADRFRTSGKVAFSQIYLGPQATQAQVDAVLAELAAGADPAALGERTLLPASVRLSVPTSVDATFGSSFFDRVHAQEVGEWSGPVRSGFGDHLVRVDEKTASSQPPLDDIRDQVVFDWRKETSETLAAAQVEALEAQYDIVRPDLSQWADEVRK